MATDSADLGRGLWGLATRTTRRGLGKAAEQGNDSTGRAACAKRSATAGGTQAGVTRGGDAQPVGGRGARGRGFRPPRTDSLPARLDPREIHSGGQSGARPGCAGPALLPHRRRWCFGGFLVRGFWREKKLFALHT
uniref:Uncharacterized protein n=1 Tax=Kalanchoe fedtschenkoi TaxID=63787 RepID=A0A7N0SYS7_KALFE